MIMTVSPDVIRKSEPIRLAGDDSVFAAARLMRQHHIGAVLVMAGDRLEGIFMNATFRTGWLPVALTRRKPRLPRS